MLFLLLIVPVIAGKVTAGGQATRILFVDLRQGRTQANQIAADLAHYPPSQATRLVILAPVGSGPICPRTAPAAYCSSLQKFGGTRRVVLDPATNDQPRALASALYGPSTDISGRRYVFYAVPSEHATFNLLFAVVVALALAVVLAAIMPWLLRQISPAPARTRDGPTPRELEHQPGNLGGNVGRPNVRPRPAAPPLPVPEWHGDDSSPPQRRHAHQRPASARPPGPAVTSFRQLVGEPARACGPIDSSQGGYVAIQDLIVWARLAPGLSADESTFCAPGDPLTVVSVDESATLLIVEPYASAAAAAGTDRNERS